MTEQENDLLNGLTAEHGLQMLQTEWDANGGHFYFHRGSPRKMKPSTDDGQLYLTLCDKLVERGLVKGMIEQVRFFYALHRFELERDSAI